MPTANDIYYFAHQESQKGKLPVVLIHGAGGHHLHWSAQTRRMDDFRVYAPDLPGHGRSEGRGYQSIPSYTDHILNWMDELQMNQAAFVGHSMGGGIALTLGLEHPDRTIGLGLIGTGARLRILPALIEAAGREETFPLAVEKMIEMSFSPESDPRLVELAGARMVETRPSVLQGD
ncbi:MAG: alpha/beta fold hydrolase, partial [candidate division Zixibacteria bacterium]|nr:alpha/beta hydrolase [candidate division Zixibacteria bacterium]NIW50306.1 alpha/beta fold hydrolase [Gammaproteobacteria bacterium]NIR67974.1 alpha/beta hydrolase [candidate division Zixibacteria bacterium]NIS49184.1 alpha/beta hydrolase [candidate division Zixibacteria bacterium]NIU17288.1 alpha/beta hydrolase [candidate division Zixibacteria bacterium]